MGKGQEHGPKAEKDKIERATGLGKRTREEIYIYIYGQVGSNWQPWDPRQGGDIKNPPGLPSGGTCMTVIWSDSDTQCIRYIHMTVLSWLCDPSLLSNSHTLSSYCWCDCINQYPAVSVRLTVDVTAGPVSISTLLWVWDLLLMWLHQSETQLSCECETCCWCDCINQYPAVSVRLTVDVTASPVSISTQSDWDLLLMWLPVLYHSVPRVCV